MYYIFQEFSILTFKLFKPTEKHSTLITMLLPICISKDYNEDSNGKAHFPSHIGRNDKSWNLYKELRKRKSLPGPVAWSCDPSGGIKVVSEGFNWALGPIKNSNKMGQPSKPNRVDQSCWAYLILRGGGPPSSVLAYQSGNWFSQTVRALLVEIL